MKSTVLLGLLFPLLCFAQPPAAPSNNINFKLKSLKGEELSLKSFKKKYVLVRFWASWCTPCKRDLPLLNQFYRENSESGLSVLAVSLDENEADAKRYLQDNPVHFPVVFDLKKELPEQFSMDSLASVYLFDDKGKFVASQIGLPQSTQFYSDFVNKYIDL